MRSLAVTPVRRRWRTMLMLALTAGVLLVPGFGGRHAAQANGVEIARFRLLPNPSQLNCLARYPNDPRRAPLAEAVVLKGKLNDTMVLRLENIKPNLAFDLFTVQRSNLNANGVPDPTIKFGLAWYQSDVEVNSEGRGYVEIKTVLLNQIFGFDPDVQLAPTNTFHVGFWFNDPNDAAACGFNVNNPTPFNGEHRAGPLAMISTPNPATGLGPLCINPDTSTTPARCNP